VSPPLPSSSNRLIVLALGQAPIERLTAARTEHVAPELLPSLGCLTVYITERSSLSRAGQSLPRCRAPSSTPEPRRAAGSSRLAAAHRRATLLIYGEPPPPLLCPKSTASAHLLLSPVQPFRAPPAAVQARPVQSATVPRSLPGQSCVAAPLVCATPPPHALRERLAERMCCMGCALQRRPWLTKEESCFHVLYLSIFEV
jgi:hypothetical protein